MNKKFVLLLCVCLLLQVSCSLPKSEEDELSRRPNIIFIMTDDQSSLVPAKEDAAFDFSDGNGRGIQSHPFGFNGDEAVHTPHIDQLAREGMVFTRAYVSSSVCSPSRYTTLTGRYAGRCEGTSFISQFPLGQMTRIENNTELEESRENLPRLLQKAGYRTGFVGKSHVIDHHLLRKSNWEAYGLKSYKQGADPNQFIEQSGDEPFFLYYSETVPHGPAPWIRNNGKYTYGLDANPRFTGEGLIHDDYKDMPTRGQILEGVRAAGKDPDHAWLSWFDEAVGAVVEKLKEKGKLENTLIIITSDHGNYNYGKSTLYEGGVKIPLMMYWPAGIKPGSRYEELVQNVDYTPTFLELAGVELSSAKQLDGVSLVETLKGKQSPVHDHLFFELGFARGVMTKEWKYIAVRYDEKSEKQIAEGVVLTGWNGHKYKQPYYIRNSHLGYHAALLNEHYFERNQLFDMRNDPKENQNIAEANPDKVEEMRRMLIKSLESFPERPYGELVK